MTKCMKCNGLMEYKGMKKDRRYKSNLVRVYECDRCGEEQRIGRSEFYNDKEGDSDTKYNIDELETKMEDE